MRGTILSLLCLAGLAAGQDSSASTASPSVITLTGSSRQRSGAEFGGTVTVPSDFEGSTFATLTSSPSGSTASSNATVSATDSVINIGGGNRTRTPTGSATGSAALPQNTQACNNYVEFCNRKYSNITEVAAHNSPFTKARNIARNQDYGVTQQLNDGIRMLQGQAHYVNNTLYLCHSSCDLLNAGTLEDYLEEVVAWVEAHPFDVVTIIFGNYNYADKDANGNFLITAKNFDEPIRSSGLYQYIYQPPKTAMELADWPTLGQMLLQQKRVVTFIDYNADTDAVPYLLWEFYSMWETPFSPTDINFPCTIGRPDGVSDEKARDMLYMANHNLNVEIAIAGLELLVPNVAATNITNGLEGNGSLGLMANQCTSDWGRPPNFLLVDFYNQGPVNGSVFEVAARANNVTYTRECCGKATSLATALLTPSATYFALVVAAVGMLMM
ncbi:PLC-like phosphodiesterase [Didymella exigua CBS 183.55]|uniref:PLC-like phosphodiesterase n=1 Tax=Didymella exigua CBS 183.55 TaxID=1150837 RepID=A0A6A5RNP6_9PLEO|nr:PLC-like phosphodiesterase [Didymella exigua CBS 183.55]KAF1928768.1 PLC-like phosphodiesterase [Didymella exigua CBS 183.55]